FRAVLKHDSHACIKEKEKQLTNNLKSTNEMHWRDWLERMADNDLWITNKYITNPSEDGEKMHIPTLRD
ncbi:hypothetical protein V8B97DRAFT_1876597, partial [Scleroderma yunnanense]